MRKVALIIWLLFGLCAINCAAYSSVSTTSISKISHILANFKASSSSLGFDLTCAIDCSPYAALNKTQGIRFAMPEARIHQCLSDNKYDVTQPPIVRVAGSIQPIIISYHHCNVHDDTSQLWRRNNLIWLLVLVLLEWRLQVRLVRLAKRRIQILNVQ